MTVRFALVKNDGSNTGMVAHGCFGTLMAHSGFRNSDNITFYTKDFDYIQYYQFGSDQSSLKYRKKNVSFRYKLFNEIMEKFPWMKEIITVEYENRYNKLKGSKRNIDKGALIAKIKLDAPGDTVWFCLNLFRLVTRPSLQNTGGLSSGYPKDFKSPLEIFYEITGDAWKAVLLTYGTFPTVNSNFSGENVSYQIGVNSFGSTCLLPIASIKKEMVEIFIKDPINSLNKFDNVKESGANRGFFGKERKYDYFTAAYCGTHEDYLKDSFKGKGGDEQIYYKLEAVIKYHFGEDILNSVKNIFNFTNHSNKKGY